MRKNEEKEFEKIAHMNEAEINQQLIKLGYNPQKIEQESNLSELAKKIISKMAEKIAGLEAVIITTNPPEQFPDTEADGIVFCGKCGKRE